MDFVKSRSQKEAALIVSRRIQTALEWLTAAFLLVMMLLTFVDVLGRYLFSSPVFGAAEMIQFLLAASVFSGLGLVSARDEHITVELFTPKLEKLMPRLQPLVVRLFSVAGLVLIGTELARIGAEALHTGRATIVLEWPIAIVAIPSSAACLLAAILQILAPRNA